MRLTVNKCREQNPGDMNPIFTSNLPSTSQTFLQINKQCRCSLLALSHRAGIAVIQTEVILNLTVRRFKPAESLSSSPLMRKKPAMPLARGADIVRSTLPTTPETPGKRDNPGKTRNDTYHGNIREYSDTDYAPSISRFLRFH